MRVSNSKLDTFQRCRKKYEFKYPMGLRIKRPAIQLKRGGWIHDLLIVHYDGHDWKERHKELTADFMKLFEEEREEYGNLPAECARIMISYLMKYQKRDKGLITLDSEIDEMVELPNGDKFQFIIDLLVEDPLDHGIWLWDHKTAKRFMPPGFMLLTAQLTRYVWGAHKLGIGPIRGVMFNELIPKPPTVPAVLKSGRLTQKQNMHCDVYTFYRAIRKLGHDPAYYASTLRRLKSQDDRFFRRTRM